MSVLTSERRETLTALVDAIHPAVDDLPSASALGVVDSFEAALTDVDWNGDRWFADGPHEPVPHPGHGWQGEGTPAELFARTLDALAEPVRAQGADAVVAAAADDSIDLHFISSADLVRLLQRQVLVAATGIVLR